MKILLTLLVLLFSSSVLSYEEMYYCSDIESGGFHDTGGGYELAYIRNNKFKIKIDISRKTIDSSDLQMKKGSVSEAKCERNISGNLLSCNNAYAQMFTFNTETSRYTYASAFGNLTGADDSMWVSYGTCEKF